MKIYCFTCKEYILEKSDKFVMGGPYNGAMFEPATNDRYSASMFERREDIKDGNLFCPRCMGHFIDATGSLLTEHGFIVKGQESIDETYSIVRTEGDMKGHLMYIKPSRGVIKELVVEAEDIPSDDEEPEINPVETKKQEVYRLKDTTNMSNKAISRKVGISTVTLYKYLKERKR